MTFKAEEKITCCGLGGVADGTLWISSKDSGRTVCVLSVGHDIHVLVCRHENSGGFPCWSICKRFEILDSCSVQYSYREPMQVSGREGTLRRLSRRNTRQGMCCV